MTYDNMTLYYMTKDLLGDVGNLETANDCLAAAAAARSLADALTLTADERKPQ